jgi:hypothetical protein
LPKRHFRASVAFLQRDGNDRFRAYFAGSYLPGMCEDKPVRRLDLKVFSANPVLFAIWRYQTGAVSTAGPDFKLVAHRLETVRTTPLRQRFRFGPCPENEIAWSIEPSHKNQVAGVVSISL